MELLHELGINAVAYLVVAVLAAAGLAVLRIAGGGPWLPIQRLRRGGWSGGEVFLLFLIYLVVPGFVVVSLAKLHFFSAIFDAEAPALRQFNVAELLTTPLVFAIHLTVLYQVCRTFPRHIGLSPAGWRGNVSVAIAAFLIVAPVVLLLHFVTLLFTIREEHALEELVRQPLQTWEWGILIVRAVVLAPIMEEWLFRGLFQGWLRRASVLGHFLVCVFALFVGAQPTLTTLNRHLQGEDVAVLWEPLAFAALLVGIYATGVLRLWRPVLQEGLTPFIDGGTKVEVNGTANAAATPEQPALPLPALHGPRWEKFKRDNARWSIFGSAMMFAVFHYAWPSPIALFALGLILGWLAYRTQNLVPSIVMHALFNLVACLVLIYSVSTGASGNDETTALRPESAGAIVSSVPGS